MKRGLLLLAHGARDAQWSAPFAAVAAGIAAADPAAVVRLAYLEFMPPTGAAAGAELAAAGCTEIAIVPLFLGAGGHVSRDLPPMRAALAREYPQAKWTLQPAIGEDPRVIDAIVQAALAPRLPAAGADARPGS